MRSETSVPGSERPFLERVEEPAAGDLEIVSSQLGRNPRGRLFVAARCPQGRPSVILSLPTGLEGGPVPPLLWLTCPHASSKAAALESEGGVSRLGEEICSDPLLTRAFEREEREFAGWSETLVLEHCGMEIAGKVKGRGAAWGRPGSVKCLHAHLACWLASGRDVLGKLCFEELERKGGTYCERPPEACVY